MKKHISDVLGKIIKPFYGSGIGNYRPFSQISKFYDRLIKDDTICKTIYGLKIKTHSTDNVIRKSLKINGYREKNISELIIKNTKQGDICLDIGANIGYDTMLMAKQVGDRGKVYAIEPIKKNYDLILENNKLNNFNNIIILPYGAGSKNEELEIHFSLENPGGSSIYSNNRSWDNKEKILIKILDEEIKEDKIDFIKMDVEGHEFHALLGIKNIIKNKKPKIIIEWSPILYQDEEVSLNILSFLLENKYEIFHIHINGELEQINDIKEYYHRINNLDFAQSDIYAYAAH